MKTYGAANIVLHADGAVSIEAADGTGLLIEAGDDDPTEPEAVRCPGDGCTRAVIARADHWTRCACGTETTVLA